MGHALKVIKFDSEENQDNELGSTKNSSLFSSTFSALRIAAITTAILGIISLVLEVHFFFQFRYEIYLARLIPTLISLVTLTLLQSKFGRKNFNFLTHIYLFTVLASISFVSFKLPNLYGYNAMGTAIFMLLLSMFVDWERKNQIIATVYFTVLFGAAAFLAGMYTLADQNMFVIIPSVLILLSISVISNTLRFGKNKKSLATLMEDADLNTDSKLIDQKFFSNSVVPLFRSDKEGNFEFFNSSFRELLNLSDDTDLTELNLFEDIIKNEKVINHFLKKMENKGKVEAYRFKYEDRNGEEEVFLMDCKSIAQNNDIFIEGSIRNITKQYESDKLLRQEIETLKNTKRQTNKVIPSITNNEIRKTNIISKMGHELRTPMNSVLGFLTLIENGLFENEAELKEFSHSAKLSAESLLGLLNDVVEIAKIQEGILEPEYSEFNLNTEIEKLTDAIDPHLKQKELEMIQDIDESIPDVIISDKYKYLQILTNLLRYAINESEKGQIHLTIRRQKLTDDKMNLITIVEDSGEGIDERELDKLMNHDLEKKDKDSKITSNLLHIMISRELIKLLEGKFSAKSEIGKGTKFTFEIEIESSLSGSENSETSDGLIPSINRKAKAKLLLVEDNPISRKVEQKLLHEAGYEVDSIDTAAKAIEMVDKGCYDLVLMDIELKDMNGLEATKVIRELNDHVKNIPIIAVTAHSSMKDREKCLIAGMNDYISKPINITFLKMTIDQWVNSARSK